MRAPFLIAVVVFGLGGVSRAADYPRPVEADVTLAGFHFATGETLDLKVHYRTVGRPRRDRDGQGCNAVLILHGTTGSGAQFVSPQFAGELFGKGQPLDA